MMWKDWPRCDDIYGHITRQVIGRDLWWFRILKNCVYYDLDWVENGPCDRGRIKTIIYILNLWVKATKCTEKKRKYSFPYKAIRPSQWH